MPYLRLLIETMAEYGVAEFSSSLNSYDGCFFQACWTYSCKMHTNDFPFGFIIHSFCLVPVRTPGLADELGSSDEFKTGNVINLVPSGRVGRCKCLICFRFLVNFRRADHLKEIHFEFIYINF